MIMMVGDAKYVLNDGCHAFGRPDLPSKAVSRRTAGQEDWELGPLFGGEAGLSTGGRVVPQGSDPASSGPGHPLAHGTLGHTERGGNIFLLPPLLIEFPGTEAATFAPVPWLLQCCSFHRDYVTRY